MKILMLTTNSSLMDGINRHILTVSTELNRRNGIDVAVCTVMPAGELHDALKHNCVKSFALGFANGHKLGIIPAFARIMRSFKPDVVHYHVLAMMERIVAATMFRGTRYVATIHGIADKKDYTTMHEHIEHALNQIFTIPLSARCYISSGVRTALQDRFPNDAISEVCYNPIPFGYVPPKEYALHRIINVPHNTQIIGTACRISFQKNPQAFTAAMCQVLQAAPQVHAVVIGDGSDDIKTECHEIVAKTGVGDRFHWLGYRSDAPSLTRDLDCFVMTSRWEGLPTALLESMAVRTPIVMMEGEGGLQDLAELNRLEGPIAVVTPQGDTGQIASGITHLLNDPAWAAELADRAYQVGQRHFDVASVVNQLINLYTRITQ